MAASPPPIDPRGPRFNQAMVSLVLVGGFLLGWRPVAAVIGLVLLAGAAFGPRYGPFLRLYADLIRPRLAPPDELEDPRPPRFAAAVGVAFLAAATAAFAAGHDAVDWVLALVVAALAGLAAATGVCLGCEVYLLLARRPRLSVDRGVARVPLDMLGPEERTWLVFTTPYCATCAGVVASIRSRDPEARVVELDAVEHAALTRSFLVRSAPTVVLADGDGNVRTRLVGAAAVEAYLRQAV